MHLASKYILRVSSVHHPIPSIHPSIHFADLQSLNYFPLPNIFPHPLNNHSSLCLPTCIIVEQGLFGTCCCCCVGLLLDVEEQRRLTVDDVVGEDGDDEGGEQKEEMDRGLFGRDGRDAEGEGEVVFEEDGEDDDDDDDVDVDVVVGELRKERRERGLVEGDVGADEERCIFVLGRCNGLLVGCGVR